MKMKWGKAFKGALKTILYSIVWYLLGYALFFGGLSYVFSRFTSYASLSPMYASNIADDIILGGFMMFFGMIIILIGTLASFYKVFAELLAEEVKG
jgi:ammonia channel protein AmtB